MSDILKAVNLTKRFPGVIANENVNFDLRAGEVHCLFGENGAGKSTLSSCLFGFYQPEGGHIEIGGEIANFKSPRDAIHMGVGMVHQHFVLVAEFSVLENIVVGTHESGWQLKLTDARKRVEGLCAEYSIDLDLDARVGDLAVGQQQWVEILKALFLDAKVLILDEPSAVLTPEESLRLFRIIDHMKELGLSILLISHKMVEVMQADRVTVLRKGKVVDTVCPANVTPNELTRMMVGRDVELRMVRDRTEDAERKFETVLNVEKVSYRDGRGKLALDNVSLHIGKGEILGLAGVSGNGQKELFEILSGVLVPENGCLSLDGERIEGLPSRQYMDRGVGLVPDDRFREGLIPEFNIRENMILGWQRHDDYTNGMFLDHKQIGSIADGLIDEFQIATPSGATPVNHLSGGNAQKVILAREFVHSSKLLLANQPTRGLDLGVIEYVYKQIIAKREEGYAILLASEELEDLLNLSDRIAVMSGGKITGIVDPLTTTVEEIGLLMAGGKEEQAA
ncbi:Galactose/methyl galactoside import ATP-binding protein MglA [Roseovarius albus]|uniref:Galactose/methyl galactoside import ATP-binding protein MglA n=1 Tax=Roseovarius albus TaxID=1247867 RepID=A0A1X7A5F7_9RHOB|nr:ABC transporter ATP-binding protein [Roseovarius albus]SLN70686.1 Galactose/methyl galactoside import ATP-binding protein MglA [Roseovarius albus]